MATANDFNQEPTGDWFESEWPIILNERDQLEKRNIVVGHLNFIVYAQLTE